MKNVICIVLDSLCYERLMQMESSFGEKPFLLELAEHGTSYEKMYSQAPYTEAAAQALYCGQKTLDRGGHMYRFRNAEKTVFEAMKELGYKTYCSNLLLQLFPSSAMRGVDDYRYNSGYEMDGLWSYRLCYYRDLLSKGKMTKADYRRVMTLMDENFASWDQFFASLKDETVYTKVIRNRNYPYDAQANCDRLQAEMQKYQTDKKQYITELLRQGSSHSIYTVEKYTGETKVSPAVREEAWKRYRRTVRRIMHCHVRKNFWNALLSRGAVCEWLKLFRARDLHGLKVHLAHLYYFIFPEILQKRFFRRYDACKTAPSFLSFLNEFDSWRKENGDQPYFACIHVDDIHNPEIFFTYDTEDFSVMDREMQTAERMIRKIRKGYTGPLVYDIGIMNAGEKIRGLWERMKAEGTLDNTVFVVTSDHGFSYQGTPVREKAVSTYYRENYHIPFIISSPSFPKTVISDYHSSYEIPNILTHLCADSDFTEHPTACGDFATIEFMGAGCPDIGRKEMKLACHDDEVMVFQDVNVNSVVTADSVGAYDLRKDPGQSHPISVADLSSRQQARAEEFIRYMNHRIGEVKEQYRESD